MQLKRYISRNMWTLWLRLRWRRILTLKIVSFEDNELSCSLEKIEMKMKNYHVWVWDYELRQEVENMVILQDYTLVTRMKGLLWFSYIYYMLVKIVSSFRRSTGWLLLLSFGTGLCGNVIVSSEHVNPCQFRASRILGIAWRYIGALDN